MSHASLRKSLVAIYAYTDQVDSAGIASSVYVRQLSPRASGLWWAARGTLIGKETSPAGLAQANAIAYFSFDAHVPITETSLIAEGKVVDGVFQRGRVYRVEALHPRNYFRSQIQAVVRHVDKADEMYTLTEPV